MYSKSYWNIPGDVGVGIGNGVSGGGISKMSKFFMWWARHWQASFPVCGQVLFSSLLNEGLLMGRICSCSSIFSFKSRPVLGELVVQGSQQKVSKVLTL